MMRNDRYDIHARRHRLKLRRDDGATALYENRDAEPCPICGDPFDTLFASERRSNRFDPDDAFRFCLRRESDRILVFTH